MYLYEREREREELEREREGGKREGARERERNDFYFFSSFFAVGPPRTTSIVNEVFEGVLESRVKCLACKKVSVTREPFQDLSLPIPGTLSHTSVI